MRATRLRIPYWQFLLLPTLAFFLGATLNQIAMVFNGGAMPVLVHSCPADGLDWLHTCWDSHTHLKFLTDWINLHTMIASVGDMLLWAGQASQDICWIIWAVLIINDANYAPAPYRRGVEW
jgi:hypothetical protein